MPALILTSLGGGDVAFNVIDDKGWRQIAKLSRTVAPAQFVAAVDRLVDGWLDSGDARIVATGSMQRGVIERVGRKFNPRVGVSGSRTPRPAD